MLPPAELTELGHTLRGALLPLLHLWAAKNRDVIARNREGAFEL